jgi:hypothetical protein
VKCEKCQNTAKLALMWCEHRAYVPSCDRCLPKVKQMDCFKNGGLDAVKDIEFILRKKRKRAMEKRAYGPFHKAKSLADLKKRQAEWYGKGPYSETDLAEMDLDLQDFKKARMEKRALALHVISFLDEMEKIAEEENKPTKKQQRHLNRLMTGSSVGGLVGGGASLAAMIPKGAELGKRFESANLKGSRLTGRLVEKGKHDFARRFGDRNNARISKLLHKAQGRWDDASAVIPAAAVTLGSLGGLYLGHRYHKKQEALRQKEHAATKTAAVNPAGKALAAVGGGVSLLRDGLNEWDIRHNENRALKRIAPEHLHAANDEVSANRSHRLKRMALNAGLSAGGGALAGHYGQKAVGSMAQHAAERAKEGIRGVAYTAADPRPGIGKIIDRIRGKK